MEAKEVLYQPADGKAGLSQDELARKGVCHTAGGVPLGKRRNHAQYGDVEAAFGAVRRVHQHAAGLAQGS